MKGTEMYRKYITFLETPQRKPKCSHILILPLVCVGTFHRCFIICYKSVLRYKWKCQNSEKAYFGFLSLLQSHLNLIIDD